MARPVYASTQLKANFDAIGPAAYTTFVNLFTLWIDGGRVAPHPAFGRLKTEKFLSHLHLRPMLQSGMDQWNRDGTSDRNLFFVDGTTSGLFLLNIVGDPGAHDMWLPQKKRQLAHWEALADAFYHHGINGVKDYERRKREREQGL